MTGPGSMPPRGWYPDPGGTSAWRWWDGTAWTEHLQASESPTSTSRQTVSADALLGEAEAGRRLLAPGLALIGIALVVSAVATAFLGSWTHSYLHWFKEAFDVRERNGASAPIPQPPTKPGWFSLVSLLTLPMEIVGAIFLLSFQHRAATIARALGRPARLSPTLGVVGWFIPIANLVLPLLAWLDLVPADDPLRRRMMRVWFAYLVMGAANVLGVVAAVFSTFFVGICSGIALVGIAVCLTTAPDVIRGVLAQHAEGTSAVDFTAPGPTGGL